MDVVVTSIKKIIADSQLKYNIPVQIKYNKKDKNYYLISKKEEQLEKEEILILIKILLKLYPKWYKIKFYNYFIP